MRNRHSIRLDGYDYSKSGMYFVTIDVQDKLKLFWGENQINEIGVMLETIICEIPIFYKGINIIEYVIMPDHIHMIIEISNVGADPRIRPKIRQICPKIRQIRQNMGHICQKIGQTQGSARTDSILKNVGADPRIRPCTDNIMALPDIIQRFKTLTTKRYVDGVANNRWPRFNRRLWQRNYYERIIRNQFELDRVRKYIIENPIKVAAL